MKPDNSYVYKTPSKDKNKEYYNTDRNNISLLNDITEYVYFKRNVEFPKELNTTSKVPTVTNNLNLGPINNNGNINTINNVTNNNIIKNIPGYNNTSGGYTTYYPPDYYEFKLNNSATLRHPFYKRKPPDNKPIYNTDYIQ